jgi:prolipoprotein diacylglyceryltransferase
MRPEARRLAKALLEQHQSSTAKHPPAEHFNFNGASCTWYGMSFAFGLMFSAFLSLSTVAAWQLENVSSESRPVMSRVAWTLVAAYAFNAVLSRLYFFAGPGVLASVVTVLLGVGAWRKQQGKGMRLQR